MLIVTHDGRWHADEVMAIAIIKLAFPNQVITTLRTRDPMIIDRSDVAVDVGYIYEPSARRFDHHQKQGAGRRQNGCAYASSGLIWKHYGDLVLQNLYPDHTIEDLFDEIDSHIIQPIDASDNRQTGRRKSPLSSVIASLFPHSESRLQMNTDQAFNYVIELATHFLISNIEVIIRSSATSKLIKTGNCHQVGPILIFNKCVAIEAIELDESVLFVAMPSRQDARGVIKTVPVTPRSQSRRKLLPLAWAGLHGHELEAVSGIEGASFCHKARFLATATSIQGAIQLAQKAISLQ